MLFVLEKQQKIKAFRNKFNNLYIIKAKPAALYFQSNVMPFCLGWASEEDPLDWCKDKVTTSGILFREETTRRSTPAVHCRSKDKMLQIYCISVSNGF